VDIINNLFWDLGVPGYGSGRVVELGLSSGGQTYSCSATRASNVASMTGCACLSTNCPATGIGAGDWVLTSCTDPSFNVSRVPALTSNPNTNGPVTYSNPGPDVPLTAAVGCTLSNSQGWPRKLNYRHNTMVAIEHGLTLVSIREAAIIQLLSLPATPCRRNYLARFRLLTPLPLRSLIEEFQSLFYRALLLIEIIFSCGNHADRFPSRAPLQLISWLIPYWSAMALGTVNCSLLVTLGISLL